MFNRLANVTDVSLTRTGCPDIQTRPDVIAAAAGRRNCWLVRSGRDAATAAEHRHETRYQLTITTRHPKFKDPYSPRGGDARDGEESHGKKTRSQPKHGTKKSADGRGAKKG